ncbi:MAG: peptide ligase PGM1-related protein [Candidatus Eiseniibacteriota bacterium]
MTTLAPPTLHDTGPPEEKEAFARLQERLLPVWKSVHAPTPWSHTSVVVPSISFNQEELTKIRGVPFYEERLLFTLMRLRHPAARVLYVTSQPIHPDIVDYYLHLLVGVPSSHAWKRLAFLCVYDGATKPLTEKILERPRVIERIVNWVGDPRRAYLTCFNTTALERRLAVALDIPLNGLDPGLGRLGTKSGSREVFASAGVDLPAGFNDLRTREEFADALLELKTLRPKLRRAVLKLNEGFSGEGNALFRYPEEWPDGKTARRSAVGAALERLEWNADHETAEDYFRKLAEMGGIVEEFLEAEEVRSPSVQMRIFPDGSISLISTHDQVLGGNTGQAYVGCRFPAAEEYRFRIRDATWKIAEVLRDHGVVSRFGVDFLAARNPGEEWKLAALEINLRMGGTTHPFQALQFLTCGELDRSTGLFVAPGGTPKFYFSTDGLYSPSYLGLLPEDLLDIVTFHGLHFRPSTQTGVLFHMIGALSQFGKVGVTCIGDSRDDADRLYRWTVEVLDRETGATGRAGGSLRDPFHDRLPHME